MFYGLCLLFLSSFFDIFLYFPFNISRHHFLEGGELFRGLDGLDAKKELGEVVNGASREGIVILASSVLEVTVALVVEHLVGRQVHGGVQQLLVKCFGENFGLKHCK